METNIITITNSIALFVLGFVPTLTALEVSCKMAHRLGKKRKKENAALLTTTAASVGASKETTTYNHDDRITIRGENGIYEYS